MIDLHGVDDGRFDLPVAMNARSQVVGLRYFPYPGDSSPHAFSWTKATGMIDLTPGDTSSESRAVSDNGQIVGWMGAPDAFHAFSWTALGGLIDLGTLDRTSSVASDVNARGHVVGSAHSPTGDDQAFLWTEERGMIDLGGLGGSTQAWALSDNGQIVGVSGTVDNAEFHAFWWTRQHGMIDLGALGGFESGGFEINDRGQIAGYFLRTAVPAGPFPETHMHAAFWEPIANLGCRATLARCDLRAVNLTGAYLKGQNLRHANLQGANLTKATLLGARLAGANVHGVKWSDTVCVDGTSSDANGGTCVGHL
jgi:probable HAF family extracellular repeat protein